jgi:hypothetical protein
VIEWTGTGCFWEGNWRPYGREENDESIARENYCKNTQNRNEKKMNMMERERLMKKRIVCICLNVTF